MELPSPDPQLDIDTTSENTETYSRQEIDEKLEAVDDEHVAIYEIIQRALVGMHNTIDGQKAQLDMIACLQDQISKLKEERDTK